MQTILASTLQGPVLGQILNGCHVFKGVPYAAAPVGDLRWRAPAAAPIHQETLECVSFRTQCPQERMSGGFYFKEFYSEDGDVSENSEDCLFLNIWTPADLGMSETNEALPVLFWIHGGAFNHGSGNEKEFDGEALARRGVILVTINYRVGPFGFLYLPELAKEDPNGSSGNYGMLDQLCALQWVRDNIAFFGGDPSRITIMGQSAGAMSVQSILSSPLAKGKFAQAIMQSGGGIDGGLVQDNPVESAAAYGKAFCEAAGTSSLKELRSFSFDEILAISKKVQFSSRMLPLRPVLDGYFQTESFHDVLFGNRISDVPCMIGSNTEDIGAKPKDQRNGEEHSMLEQACINFASVRCHTSEQPAYVYRFARQLPGDDAGAFHSAELWYMFGTLKRCWRPMTEHDYALSEEMLSAWSDFAKGEAPWKAYEETDGYIRIWE